MQFRRIALIFCLWLACADNALAQCAPGWLPSPEGVAGVDQTVRAYARWDPDGSGPQPERIVVGGSFTRAGPVFAQSIATWDGEHWSALGAGVFGGTAAVNAIAVLPDHRLVVGGHFSNAGGISASNIAIWDGTTWSALGTGANNDVTSLAVLPSGELVAGGIFSTMNGASVGGLALWTGTAWQPFGGGTNGIVTAVQVGPAGEVYVGGSFTQVGTTNAAHIARWASGAWQPLSAGVNDSVDSIALSPTDVYVTGRFSTAGGSPANGVARWNGTQWFPLGAGIQGIANCAAVLPGGDLIIGGGFTLTGQSMGRLARWNGSTWSPVVTGTNSGAYAILIVNDSFIVQGNFGAPGVPGGSAIGIVRWTGSSWAQIAPGFTGSIRAFLLRSDGSLVVGGLFEAPGTLYGGTVAAWDGAAWSSIGLAESPVCSLAETSAHELIVGGVFTTMSGTAARAIAKWDGAVWHPMGSGMTHPDHSAIVRAIAVLPGGDIIAGGDFAIAGGSPCPNIARWGDGTWEPLGQGLDAPVWALAVLPNGDLVAGGDFTHSGATSLRFVARWDGATWGPMSGGMDSSVVALAATPNGGLVAGGNFAHAGTNLAPAIRVARWDGADWQAMGSGFTASDGPYRVVDSLSVMPDGRVVAGGLFTASGPVAANRIAVWDGVSWGPLGLGVSTPLYSGTTGEVLALTLSHSEILAGGEFATAGSFISPAFARWSLTGAPWIAHAPTSAGGVCGEATDLVVTVAQAYQSVSFQWQVEASAGVWNAVQDGPLLVDGHAAATLVGSQSGTLEITPTTGFAPRSFRCVVSNGCGSAVSDPALVSAAPCCGSADFNCDNDVGTDADIEAFFACLSGICPGAPCVNGADFNGDGDVGTDADIEAFFRVLAGGHC